MASRSYQHTLIRKQSTQPDPLPATLAIIQNPEEPKRSAAKGMPKSRAIPTEMILKVPSLKYAANISPAVV